MAGSGMAYSGGEGHDSTLKGLIAARNKAVECPKFMNHEGHEGTRRKAQFMGSFGGNLSGTHWKSRVFAPG
jgi:hypothetical protein